MMLKSLPKFLLAVFTILFFQKLNAQTETEPNNTAATANTLALNGSISGSIISGDVDWYKVTTNSDGRIRLTFSALNGADFYVTLYDGDGTSVLSTVESYSNTPAVLNADGLAQGIYYMQVYPYSNSTGLYTLADSLFKPAKVNDTEPNNYAKQALVLPLNDSMVGHLDYHYKGNYDNSDWYKVTTTGDGLLRITLSALNGADFYARLYDGDSSTVLNTVESENNSPAVLSQDGLAAGTYYIQLYPYSTSYGAYSLSDSIFFPAQANDVEPNNYAKQALTLPLNSQKGGHLDYHYKGVYDNSDWYKVTTNADGLLKITLSALNGADFYARLYNGDSTTVLSTVESENNNPAVLSYDGLAAGAYYIQLFPYSTSFGAYTLSDTLYSPAQTNDKEPNNYAIQALKLGVDSIVQGHLDYKYNNVYDNSDWYKITTPQDGYLRVTLSALNGADFYAVLYQSDSTTQVGNIIESEANNPAILNLDGLAAGTYYIHLFPYSTSFGPYTLADSLFTYNMVDKEPNDSPYQAATIPANDSVTGHIDFYGNKPDRADWWKINYTGANSGSLKINYTLDTHKTGGIGDIYFQVFSDTAGSPLDTKELEGGNNTASVILPFIAQGYYYIAVSPYSNNYGVYSITDSFTQVNIAQISINSAKTTINSSSCGTDSITYNLSGSHSPYTVRLYKNSALYDSVVTTSTIITFKNLTAGNYYATSYGDGATDSAYSKSATSTVVPPVPTALTTTGIGVHKATLNWTKLSCSNYYKVQYRAVGSQTWTVINTMGDTSKLALTGLLPYTLYVWEVASVDTTKGLTFTSAFSDSLRFTTLSDTAHIALIFKGAGSECNSDTLQYKATNSASPYTVTLYRNGVAYGSPLSVKDTASFYNVPPGNYYATATGTGSGGSYGKSDTTQIVPPAPNGLDTTNVTSATATLHWNIVSCANFYTVEYKPTGTATWSMANTNTNSLMLMGLLPATKYTWKVSASDSANKQTVTSLYSDTATFITSSLLPVTFISFNGTLQNNAALLSWSTASEINNKGYDVEKSYDGTTFNDLAFVKGKGNTTSLSNYNYTDLKVTSGSNYYRLKQIDLDGKFNYSSIIKIDYSKFGWAILGNPFSNSTWMQLQLDKQAHISIQIFSMNGNLVQSIDKGNLSAGTYSIPLYLNNVGAGTYLVRLLTGDKSYTTKIVKQ